MVDTITPEPIRWDSYVKSQPRSHFLQLSAWGDLKAAYGWDVERIALVENGQIVAGTQILFRRLPFRIGTMAYIAMGPFFNHPSHQNALWQMIHLTARRHRARFLKWEPGIYSSTPPPVFAALRFRPSPQTVQPPRTILIDLEGDDDTILSRMNQGTRRKVRQSIKNGVQCYEAEHDALPRFNAIMQVTGDRNDFGVHEPAYYAKIYDRFVPEDAAFILAEHEGDVLAGVIVLAAGRTAWYLAGASSSHKRNLMASYGVQWAAIQWAKARGCTCYDMWGIPDEEETTLEAEFQERSHDLWGVYGFKRGWGGCVTRSVGAWDYVYNPLIYRAYQLALKVRS